MSVLLDFACDCGTQTKLKAYSPHQSKLDKPVPSLRGVSTYIPRPWACGRSDKIICGGMRGGRTRYGDHPVKSTMATDNPNACNRG